MAIPHSSQIRTAVPYLFERHLKDIAAIDREVPTREDIATVTHKYNTRTGQASLGNMSMRMTGMPSSGTGLWSRGRLGLLSDDAFIMGTAGYFYL
jgi:hypothetical protein